MIKDDLLRKFKFFHRKNLKQVYDPLTEIVKREVMEDYIAYLIKRKTPFSLCIIDIDNFKSVNDNYGHRVGDKVLAETSCNIMNTAGSKGVVCRYGGDELVLVLENITDYDEVWGVCHRLNLGLGQMKVEGIPTLHITITTGVARFPIDDTTYEGLFALADKALYRGKSKGRNCFIIYLDQKHKNLKLAQDGDKKPSEARISFHIFNLLTQTENIDENIQKLFKFLVSYYNFDHLCIETAKDSNFEMYHILSRYKDLQHIDIENINQTVSDSGLVTLYATPAKDNVTGTPIGEDYEHQNIRGGLLCKIAFKEKEFGYIRVDMTCTVRVWQSTELNFIIYIANTLAMMLYFKNQTLDDFEKTEPIIVE
jgi:diguanylate cyclase (GGDEF)-like protein